jgi:hypothetical protein
VTIKEIGQVSDILDAAIQAGANSMYGITFNLQDPSTVGSTARSEAMKDARAKAEELAKLSGLKLGDIVSVSEVIGGNTYLNNFQAPTPGGLGGGGGTPVSPGELKMTMRLQVVFNIE